MLAMLSTASTVDAVDNSWAKLKLYTISGFDFAKTSDFGNFIQLAGKSVWSWLSKAGRRQFRCSTVEQCISLKRFRPIGQKDKSPGTQVILYATTSTLSIRKRIYAFDR
jgi:hypothetical protein